ncbi:MAG: hypothetical protein FWD38_05825 [Oscillospiraceae bacterium]|nr:hypothetical protein [Oscillospiraceae bacterium]
MNSNNIPAGEFLRYLAETNEVDENNVFDSILKSINDSFFKPKDINYEDLIVHKHIEGFYDIPNELRIKIDEIGYDETPQIIQNIVNYDFKNEFEFNRVDFSNKKVNDAYNEFCNLAKEDIKRCETNESVKKWVKCKKYSNFSEHDSDRCRLATKIYKKLWGHGEKIPAAGVPEIIGNELRQRWSKMAFTYRSSPRPRTTSETMSSFFTMFSNALSLDDKNEKHSLNYYSARDIKKLLSADEKVFDRINKLLENANEFSAMYSSIGNFTLIPMEVVFTNNEKVNFNTRRAKSEIWDFWDLSLILLRDERNFGEEQFKEYVDLFYMNDYVDKERNYEPLPLIPGFTNGYIAYLPEEISLCDSFFKEATKRIKSRGTTMVIALMLKKLKEIANHGNK